MENVTHQIAGMLEDATNIHPVIKSPELGRPVLAPQDFTGILLTDIITPMRSAHLAATFGTTCQKKPRPLMKLMSNASLIVTMKQQRSVPNTIGSTPINLTIEMSSWRVVPLTPDLDLMFHWSGYRSARPVISATTP